MNTSDILNKAADLIEERGWTGGTDGMKLVGPHCLESAIQAATGAELIPVWPEEYPYLSIRPCAAGHSVRAYLADCLRGRDELWTWNDESGRTQAEVIEVLRATALIEAARETQPAEVSA